MPLWERLRRKEQLDDRISAVTTGGAAVPLGRPPVVAPRDPSPSGDTFHSNDVDIDDDGVTCRRRAGLVERVPWADLNEVAIRVAVEPPASLNRYWLLGNREGGGCVVPFTNPAAHALLIRLQRMPHFDEGKRRAAFNAHGDTLVVCWKAH